MPMLWRRCSTWRTTPSMWTRCSSASSASKLTAKSGGAKSPARLGLSPDGLLLLDLIVGEGQQQFSFLFHPVAADIDSMTLQVGTDAPDDIGRASLLKVGLNDRV